MKTIELTGKIDNKSCEKIKDIVRRSIGSCTIISKPISKDLVLDVIMDNKKQMLSLDHRALQSLAQALRRL